MAERRYGPTRGAGVAIIEVEGDKTIEPAALGYAGYPGVFEKGPVGELVIASSKTQFMKKMGSYVDGFEAPDAAIDYYDVAAGAGGLALVRVTDGNELAAEKTLYARRGALLTPMGTIKAANGGRWGGRKKLYTADLSGIGDLANTTLDTGLSTLKTDEWAGGYIELEDVPNVQYPIISNVDTGVITVASDQTMLDDYTALSGSSLRYYLVLEEVTKKVDFVVGDGVDRPDSEFSITVLVDGVVTKGFPNLHTDPTNALYWVNVINNDSANDEIEVVDLWTGTHIASVRPANHYGITSAVTETTLTATIHDFTISVSPGAADATFALGTTDDTMVEQQITVTMTGVGAFDAVSDKFGALGSGSTDTLFTPNNKFTPPFTITEGGTALASADVMIINYKPFVADQLIDGFLYPDKPNAKLVKFRIVDNTHKIITVATGSDLTADGAISDEFMVSAATPLEGGRDGFADLSDSDYNQQAWDTTTSPFKQLFGKNMGVVKFTTPGITSTSVQKAGVAFADANNHQYRYQFPSNIVTEQAAIEYINDTLGRSDFAVGAFPTYCYVSDPEGGGQGKLKLVTNVGQIHGREASIARNADGYHKAEAGQNATLPKVLKITTGDALLDEEQLNPVGIQVIKKMKGNFVIWGDRTFALDPAWKWKHQRELMSYYEHVLQENFDWIIFAINDPATEKLAKATLQAYFLPEWTKRALRGDTFSDAAIIKIDDENNTNATRANGDLNAAISLQLADTVERFIITIGKQGIFDSVG